MYEELTAQAKQAVTELLDIAKLKPGKLFVIGCSSSEMVGARIGNTGVTIFAGALAGGLAVRMLMWLFSEGFMELFEAARVVLNC